MEVRTELGEKEIVSVTAVDDQDAEDLALTLVMKGGVGLKGALRTFFSIFTFTAVSDKQSRFTRRAKAL